MKSSLALFALTLAACAPDLQLDHFGPEVDVFDDGTSLYLVGCADETLLGCNPAERDERMTVAIGGADLAIAPEVPLDDEPAESLLLLFDRGPFVAMVPRDADSLAITLGGQHGELALTGSFSVEAPDTAPRAQPIAIELDRPAGVDQVDVLEIVTCEDGTRTLHFYAPEDRSFTLDTAELPAIACAHELRISARRRLEVGLAIDARRVEVVTLTSTP